MSKYTDYLNEKFETSADEITILTDFLKTCAWEATAMKPFAPEVLGPIEGKIEIDYTNMNKELADAITILQDLENDSYDEKVARRDEAFAATIEEFKNELDAKTTLVDKYTNLLNNLCKWDPQEAQMKALKEFAIKELTNNMPSLNTFSKYPVAPAVDSYMQNLKKENNAVITSLTKQIETTSKNENTANEYIEILFNALNEFIGEEEQPEKVII